MTTAILTLPSDVSAYAPPSLDRPQEQRPGFLRSSTEWADAFRASVAHALLVRHQIDARVEIADGPAALVVDGARRDDALAEAWSWASSDVLVAHDRGLRAREATQARLRLP